MHNPECKHPGPHAVTCNCAIVELTNLRIEISRLKKIELEAKCIHTDYVHGHTNCYLFESAMRRLETLLYNL